MSFLFLSKNQRNRIGSFEIDLTISENHNFSAQVTSNPVEKGSLVSDHLIENPKIISLTGLITNTPLRFLGFGSSTANAQDAFLALEEIFESKEVFDLQTGFKLYENCVFVDLNLPKVRAGELRFSATFQQLRFVETQLGSIPLGLLAAAEKAFSSATQAGRQVGAATSVSQDAGIAEQVSSSESLKKSSVLNNLFGGG